MSRISEALGIAGFPIDAKTYFEEIYLKIESNQNIIYLGEAKTYEAEYRFNVAFEKAINSILDTYNSYRKELDFYMYEDFIEEKYYDIAPNSFLKI